MKKLVSILLVTAMTLTLAACGGSSSSTSEAPASDAAPAATEAPAAEAEAPAAEASGDGVAINVIAAQYGQNTQDWWAKFQESFNNDNPGINLNVEVVSWNDIYTVVNTRIANNDAPDVLNIDVFADYQADGLLLPASDFVSEETYAKMYPSFLDQSVVDGTVWAVPDLASARAMYYNTDILEAAGVEAPKTWDELKTVCEAIKASNPDVYPWGIDMTTDEGQAAFAYYSWNNGGDFVDADGNWTLNSPENVEAVNFSVGLVNGGLTNDKPATQTRYDLQDLFGAGKLAMVIAPNSLPTYIAENGSEVNFAVAPIPSNGGKASVSAGVMDRFMCFDNGHSPEKLDAIKTFFDYFYDDARYSEWVLMEGFLPATSAGAEAMAAADPAQKEWIEIVGSCKFYPTAKAEWADVKQGVIDVQQRALLGEDPQALLDELQANIAGN